jgi:LuxR family maltose regulon positive regulatory protein
VERGLSDKAIALELGITPHGVRYHLKRIYAQLGVHTREQASRKAKGAARSTGPY